MNDMLPSGAVRAWLEAQPWHDLLSQQGRLLTLETALPAAALVPERATVDERTNEPFEITVDALAPLAHFALDGLVGEQITLSLLQSDGSYRPWHGYVLAAAQLGSDGGFARYRLTMRPWLSLLAHRRDSFVFQDRTAQQIVDEVFADHPQAHWRWQVSEPLRLRSLCCQYRETDLDFVARLLAEEGLSYHFEHLAGADAAQADRAGQARHCLVITDRQAPRVALGPVRFAQARDLARRAAASEVDTLDRLAAVQRAATNAASVGAWNYKRLAGAQGQDRSTFDHGALPTWEHYDGAGAYRYENDEHAQRAATLVLQREEQHYRRVSGEGTVRLARPGASIDVTEHPSLDGAYTLVQVRHEVVNNLGAQVARLLGTQPLEKGSYRTRLLAQPAEVPLVPPFVRKPTADGPQTALVVGLANEAITTDRDLRVKLQFHWQRGLQPNPGGLPHDGHSPDAAGNAPGNERSGTWVRVAQTAAGANWGAAFTPRIGTEVLVDFIEGDIDRPLVVGQLHNGHDLPPFAAGHDSGANHPGVIAGLHSPTLDRAGYSEWCLDDATGQLRMRLLCSYTTAEVGLGHLIQQGAGQAQRGAARGRGFEALTQGWGSLRAAGGLLVSTTARAGTYASAESTQMDAAEAVAQLQAAHDLAQRLSEPATAFQAHALGAHEPGQSVDQLLRGLDPARDGVYPGPVNGQDAVKADERRHPTTPVERPAKPTVMLDSAHSLAALTEASLTSFAGQDQAWVAQGDWHDSAAHTASLVAGRTASWYAHDQGIQIKAANGPVSLRAHTDRLEILADQDVQVLSANDEITISAKTRIELVGGDSAVVLDGANITFKTPGSFTVKAATHDWQGAGRGLGNAPTLPVGAAAIDAPPTLLQACYSEVIDFSNVPDEWLPREIAARTSVHAGRDRVTVLSRARASDFAQPLLTSEPLTVQYWLQSGATWQVEEAIEQAFDFDEEDDSDA